MHYMNMITYNTSGSLTGGSKPLFLKEVNKMKTHPIIYLNACYNSYCEQFTFARFSTTVSLQYFEAQKWIYILYNCKINKYIN